MVTPHFGRFHAIGAQVNAKRHQGKLHVKKLLLVVGCLVFFCSAILMAHESCSGFSEDEIIEFARNTIRKDRYLARHFEKTAIDVEMPENDVDAGTFVLLSILGDSWWLYAVTYQTPTGKLIDLEISQACNVNVSYPPNLRPMEHAVFARDLRTGQRYIEISRVTGSLHVPGTEAFDSGAIQLPSRQFGP